MNIKDSYLHGGTHVVKDISFSIPASGTNSGKLVATIKWASQTNGVDDTTDLPITFAGSIFGSLTQNYVLAAPSSGAGNPTFRALVAGDIPNLDAGKITSGTLTADRLPLAGNNIIGAVKLGVAKDTETTDITGKLYWVKMTNNGKIYVDVPWLNNTHYTATLILGSANSSTSNATSDTTNTSTYLNTVENGTKSGSVKITGDGTGTTVKANNGVLTITSKWQAANSTQVGYVPKLVSGGTALADSSNDYILAFTYASSGTLTPTWKKLPANAYLNTWRGIQDNLTSSENTTESLSAKQGYLLANGSARDDTKLPLAGGTMTGAIKRLYSTASNDPMIALTSNEKDVWLWRINSNSSVTTATSTACGFGLKYIGTGSDANNNLVLYADNYISTGTYGTQVAAMTMNLAGKITLAVTPNVNGTDVSLVGHKHAYTDLTGSTTTANQAIVSNGTANGWTLKTLGSRAFDSTAYLPLAGGTLTGILTIKPTNASGLLEGLVLYDAGSGSGEGCWIKWVSAGNTTGVKLMGRPDSNKLLFHDGTDWYTVYHSGNIPSNTKDAAGIVAKGVASSVYMTDSTGAPSWTTFDTTVTQSSGKLITSGAVYTAIANVEAGTVQYLGTVASSSAMTGLTAAKKGDFARVTTEFSFTDATGASVTAHVGDVVYLTNNTPGTASNWIVAHTEIDTNTWTAASTSAAGYVPKLVTGGTALASSSTDYVLAYTAVNGVTAPAWKKLPATAYSNTTGVKLVSSISGTKKEDSTVISISSLTGLSIMGGTNKFTIGNGTNYIEVSVGHGLSTKNISINGTNYALYTSASSLPTIKAPTEFGTANQILATNSTGDGLTWITKPTSNVSSALYVGGSGDLSANAKITTNGSMYLTLKEGSTYYKHKISGSGRATVTSDSSGNITINSAGYSNFVKSGSGAAAGLVPSPDTTAGTTKFLCEDGTWKLPSYTTDTVRPIYSGGTERYSSSVKTGINFIGGGATSVTFLAAGTGEGQSSSTSYGTIKISSNNDLVKFSAITSDTTYYLPVRAYNTTDTAQQLYRTAITVKGTTITASLSGNASTASNLSKGDGRGYLYQSAGTTTACTGVGSVNTATEIGIPYIGYASSANTYGIYKDLFYISGSSKYISTGVRSVKFACIKDNSVTLDDWSGSPTSGTQTGGGTTYTAGDGITISGNQIQTSNKEWYGTEAQFNALSSLNSNTTYYITAD